MVGPERPDGSSIHRLDHAREVRREEFEANVGELRHLGMA
jgi:hypothetical protein